MPWLLILTLLVATIAPTQAYGERQQIVVLNGKRDELALNVLETHFSIYRGAIECRLEVFNPFSADVFEDFKFDSIQEVAYQGTLIEPPDPPTIAAVFRIRW